MMNRQQLLARISINPNICFGNPCIRGHENLGDRGITQLLQAGHDVATVVEH